jgi:hypothetical protein
MIAFVTSPKPGKQLLTVLTKHMHSASTRESAAQGSRADVGAALLSLQQMSLTDGVDNAGKLLLSK